MIRTIVKSDKSLLTLQLPTNMIGKTIEIIAFELNEADPIIDVTDNERSEKANALDKSLF